MLENTASRPITILISFFKKSENDDFLNLCVVHSSGLSHRVQLASKTHKKSLIFRRILLRIGDSLPVYAFQIH